MLFDFRNEAWFVVRHGGPPIRMGVYEGEDAVSKFLVPEAYDGIVFNKVHGELRVNSKEDRVMQYLYVSMFGELLTGNEDFFGRGTVFHPEVVATMRRDTLVWNDNTKIDSIRLSGVGYQMPGGGIIKQGKKRMSGHGFTEVDASLTCPPKGSRAESPESPPPMGSQ